MAAVVEYNAPMNNSSRPMTPGGQRENEAPLPPVPTEGGPREELDPSYRETLQHILSSDIGMGTLLNRLKQSISSARDFAAFLKERSALEEKHAQGLKRLSRSTHDSIGRPESRQGSFAQNYRELTSIHERMADHGLQFCSALLGMSEELHELAANTEKGRKHWKSTGLSSERHVQDAEVAMEKAKHRYHSLAEQYDRARTGERQSTKFGLKKSGPQAEEDLRLKLEAADADYAGKVEAAQSQRNDLMSTHRPQTTNALQELIREADAGLSVQVQKFANLSERLFLGYGLCVTPMKGQSPIPGQSSKSLREVASSINNERDFIEHVLGFSNKAPSRTDEIKYEKHPSLSPKQQQFSDPYYNDERHAEDSMPTHGRQVSGVTPYPGEDESQYPGSPQPTHQMRTSEAPQLPQISSSGGEFGGEAGAVSSVGPAGGPGGPGHVRNLSSMGSMAGPGQPQTMRSPSPQPGPPIGQAGPGMAPQGMGQAPMGRGQVPMGRGQPQGMGRGAMLGSMGRGQPPPGFGHGPVSQNQGQPLPGGMNQGPPPQAGMGRGQAPGEIGRSQAPQGMPQDQGQLPQGGMNQGPPPGTMGRGGGMTRGAPQDMGRGAAPPGGIGRGLAPGGMGQPPQQGMPPQGADRGMAGPGSNGPTNGAPRGGGPGVNALPSRQAAQRAGPPVRPVFGVSLDELFQRDGSAVPLIVSQCVQAVDQYGLDVEGVYRTSGSANNIMELKQQFDYDANTVDLQNPAAFHQDIASLTTLLKHFLRDLPDPLLTGAQYRDFIEAAKLDDEVGRRDSIHALVNALPDPNYATMRVLAMHLYKIAQHSHRNKMTHNNLAIVFAPTLMGQRVGVNGNGPGSADIADSAWQAKVVETILDNTFQIFDADE